MLNTNVRATKNLTLHHYKAQTLKEKWQFIERYTTHINALCKQKKNCLV